MPDLTSRALGLIGLGDVDKARLAYRRVLDAAKGDRREAYNMTEGARSGERIPGMEDMSQEDMALVNRIADTSEGGQGLFNAAALPVYEGLKGLEQNTSVKPISMLADAGVPRVTKMNAKTTPASWKNAVASLLGPLLGRI
jgi:hypothetical protein